MHLTPFHRRDRKIVRDALLLFQDWKDWKRKSAAFQITPYQDRVKLKSRSNKFFRSVLTIILEGLWRNLFLLLFFIIIIRYVHGKNSREIGKRFICTDVERTKKKKIIIDIRGKVCISLMNDKFIGNGA